MNAYKLLNLQVNIIEQSSSSKTDSQEIAYILYEPKGHCRVDKDHLWNHPETNESSPQLRAVCSIVI
jgi:hypothetical protein